MIASSRRAVLLSAAALAACGPTAGKSSPVTIEGAVAGEWRLPTDRARDPWRRPAESLAFWGLKRSQTVVEFWPGAGWYSDIIAPFLSATGGRLYAANLQVGEDDEGAAGVIAEAYRRKFTGRRGLYGRVEITAFGPKSGPVAPAETADLVLFLRNLHNWMAAGIAEKAFADAFAALKPGGVLGLEEHRANPGGVPDPLAGDGYVEEAYAIKLAQEAGFVLAAKSEINANPKDTKDHPFGVWTLPPVRRSSPRGAPPNPNFDHAKYDAIGESDRMTLRFQKPLSS
jgi:predicted methyltransferase